MCFLVLFVVHVFASSFSYSNHLSVRPSVCPAVASHRNAEAFSSSTTTTTRRTTSENNYLLDLKNYNPHFVKFARDVISYVIPPKEQQRSIHRQTFSESQKEKKTRNKTNSQKFACERLNDPTRNPTQTGRSVGRSIHRLDSSEFISNQIK